MGGEPLLKAANFDVGVRLLPLLRQEIVVDRVELNEPVFSLRVDTDGRRSWDMAGVDLPVRFAGASAQRMACRFDHQSGRRPVRARSPRYRSTTSASPTAPCATTTSATAPGGTSTASTRRFSLAALDQPLQGSGSLVAEGETFEFKTTLTTPQDSPSNDRPSWR